MKLSEPKGNMYAELHAQKVRPPVSSGVEKSEALKKSDQKKLEKNVCLKLSTPKKCFLKIPKNTPPRTFLLATWICVYIIYPSFGSIFRGGQKVAPRGTLLPDRD